MEKGSNYMTNPPGIDSNNFNQQDQQGQSKAQAPMGNPAQQAQDQQQIAQNAAVQQVQAAQIQTQQQQQQQNMTDGQQQAWINQNAGACLFFLFSSTVIIKNFFLMKNFNFKSCTRSISY